MTDDPLGTGSVNSLSRRLILPYITDVAIPGSHLFARYRESSDYRDRRAARQAAFDKKTAQGLVAVDVDDPDSGSGGMSFWTRYEVDPGWDVRWITAATWHQYEEAMDSLLAADRVVNRELGLDA